MFNAMSICTVLLYAPIAATYAVKVYMQGAVEKQEKVWPYRKSLKRVVLALLLFDNAIFSTFSPKVPSLSFASLQQQPYSYLLTPGVSFNVIEISDLNYREGFAFAAFLGPMGA